MKNKTGGRRFLCIALLSLHATLLFSQQAITDAEVINASDALLKSPKAPQAWQTFKEIARAETYPSDIRSRAMFLFAVSHLLQMNTNLFSSAWQMLQTSYPEEGSSLTERLTSDDWLATCQECGGAGVKKPDTPTAAKSTSARCLNCSGTGKIFRLSPRVKPQFDAALNEIKAIANENILFAEQSKKAMSEWNPKRRITALQELVGKYAHRKDLEAAKQLLAKTEDDVAKEEASILKKKAEQALREQEEKDYQVIHSNLENLPVSGIPVMLVEIDRFIGKYPQSANRLDLEICKTKLQQRKTIHDSIWKVFYVCMGLAVLSLAFSSAKGLLTRKKKATGPLPVPGLRPTVEESDPLAGTFTDDDQP